MMNLQTAYSRDVLGQCSTTSMRKYMSRTSRRSLGLQKRVIHQWSLDTSHWSLTERYGRKESDRDQEDHNFVLACDQLFMLHDLPYIIAVVVRYLQRITIGQDMVGMTTKRFQRNVLLVWKKSNVLLRRDDLPRHVVLGYVQRHHHDNLSDECRSIFHWLSFTLLYLKNVTDRYQQPAVLDPSKDPSPASRDATF
jgi:hypothetical protein